jgi:ATP-dependent RNA helicase DeaD
MGKKDKISPKSIIGMVNRHLPDESIKIGQIEVLNNFSFFEVDQSYEQDVLQALSQVKHKGTNIGVELAK